jgi:hypothetical protein
MKSSKKDLSKKLKLGVLSFTELNALTRGMNTDRLAVSRSVPSIEV